MGHSVDDLATILRLLWSARQFTLDPDCGAPLTFNEKEYSGDKPLRIGYYLHDGFFEPSQACKRAVMMVPFSSTFSLTLSLSLFSHFSLFPLYFSFSRLFS